jgi:hypothetical protein
VDAWPRTASQDATIVLVSFSGTFLFPSLPVFDKCTAFFVVHRSSVREGYREHTIRALSIFWRAVFEEEG